MITHYEILKVQKSASLIVINAAYEALRQKYHPDNYPDDEVKRTKAERVINRLNLAYSVLSDLIKRRDYDNSLNPPTVEVIDPEQITQNSTATSETFANQRRITNIQAGFSAIIIGVFVLLFIIFPKAINNFTTPPSIEIDPENFKKYKIEHCEISSNLNQDFKCVLTNKDNKRLAKNYFVAEIYDKSGVRISNSSSFPDSDVMPEESQTATLFTHYPASDIAKINIHAKPEISVRTDQHQMRASQAEEDLKNQLMISFEKYQTRFALIDGGIFTSPILKEFIIGTITKSIETGTLDKPLPAILAHVEYTTMYPATAKKYHQDGWIHLAIDYEFQVTRCSELLAVDKANALKSMIDYCGFSYSE